MLKIKILWKKVKHKIDKYVYFEKFPLSLSSLLYFMTNSGEIHVSIGKLYIEKTPVMILLHQDKITFFLGINYNSEKYKNIQMFVDGILNKGEIIPNIFDDIQDVNEQSVFEHNTNFIEFIKQINEDYFLLETKNPMQNLINIIDDSLICDD